MGEAAEQEFYPYEHFKDEATGISTEFYLVVESAMLLWLLDNKAPLGCQIGIFGDRGAVFFSISKADLRRKAKGIARVSPRVSVQNGKLYLDARVMS